MANVDGSIRIGIELNTEQFKSGAKVIKSEYEHLRKSFSDIAKDLEKTGDMSAFKKSAESLTKSFEAVNTAMSDLMEKARASSKISVLDINTSLKSINALKGKVGSAIAHIEKSGIELGVGLDTDLTKELKTIYSELRKTMSGISLDTTIVPHVDTKRVSSQLSGVDTATQQSASSDAILSQVYADQLRAVEKFNEARRQGLNISQALTQNELALVNAYYNGLRAESQRTQERAKQQKTTSFNNKVDAVVASSVIDLPKEETKIERLKRLAEEVKADYANDAELSQVKAKFKELKNLAYEIKIDAGYNLNLSSITSQLSTVKKAAEGIKFNFAKTGDIAQARVGVDALTRELMKLKAQRGSLEGAYAQGIISEIQFRADTVDIDRAIEELENEVVEIEASINSPNTSTFDVDALTGKLGVVKKVLDTSVAAFKKLIEFSDYMVEKFVQAADTVKKFNNVLKKTVSTAGNLAKAFLSFSHDALEALGITEQLNDTMGSIGFGDLVNADLLADAIRKAINEVKELSVESINLGSDFVSSYQNIERVFKDSADMMYDYAQVATKTLGMSESAYMKSASSFGTFIKGYIESDSESLAKISNGMTQMVADYSAAYQNYTQDQIYHKLLSGLRGEVAAIEDIGLSVKAVDMQRYLDKKGIDKTWEALDSVEQTMYRVEMFFEKAKEQDIWGLASSRTQTFAGQLTYLRAQFENLKTTMGVYLMQILTPVLGLLNTILARLIQIVNTFGAFLGLLDKYSYSGSQGGGGISDDVLDGYEDAQDAVGGLTDSENGLADATDKAGKAAKKALAPFHKLNVLQDKDSGASDIKVPGVDAGGLNLNDKIESPEKTIDAWLQALKDAIAAGDWAEVGKLLAQKVEEVFAGATETITGFSDKIKPYIDIVVKTINGFVDALFLDQNLDGLSGWQNIAEFFATLFNEITASILAFTQGINWENIGAGLAQMGRQLLTSVDWEAIGTLWSEKTRILINILSGFVDEMSLVNLGGSVMSGWQELGQAMADFVNGVLNNIPWDSLGTTIGKALNGVADTITTFAENLDLSGFAERFTIGVNNIFETFDATKAVTAITTAFNKIIDAVKTTVTTLNWSAIGSDIGELIFGTLADIDWVGAGETVTTIADGILDLVSSAVLQFVLNYEDIFDGIQSFANGVVEWINDPENQSAIAVAINSFVEMLIGLVSTVDWGALYDGIAGALSQIDWSNILYLTHLGDGIVLSLKSIFGMEVFKSVAGDIFRTLTSAYINLNPAGLLWSVGSFIIEGLVNGIFEGANLQIPKLGEIFWGIIDWVKEIFGIHSPSTVFAEIGGYLIEGLIQGIQSLWGSLTEFFSTSISILITNITTWFSGIGTAIGNAFAGVTETLTTAWQTISTWFETAVTTLVTNVTTWFSGLGTAISGVFTNIQIVITTIWTNITTWLSTTITTLVTNISTWFSGVATTISTVFTNVYNTIVVIWTTISTWLATTISTIVTNVTTWFTALWTSITTIFTAIYTTAVTIWTTLKTSIETIVTTLQTTLTTIITGIQTAVTTAFTNIKTAVTTIVTALKTSVEGVFTALKTSVTNIFNSIKETVISVFNGIKEGIKSPINAIIGFVESMCNGLINGINMAINALNSLSVDVPDWVPNIGGQTFGFDITPLSTVSIPRLADGAVIKPNQRFLAELGDQTRGINIETPLETMLDAFRGALAEGNYGSGGDITIPVYIGSDLIDEVVVDANNRATYRNNGR